MKRNNESIMGTLDKAYKNLCRWEIRSAANDNPISVLIFLSFMKFITDNKEKLGLQIKELNSYDYLALLYGEKVFKEQIVKAVREIEEQFTIKNSILAYYAENLRLLELTNEFKELLLMLKGLDLTDDKNECFVLHSLINYIMLQSKKELRFTGEFITDANLSKLMASICQIESGMTVYDFACGYSTSLAIAAEGKEVEIYAQDINPICNAVSVMLLTIGFNKSINVFCGDSLQHPCTMNENIPAQFDVVLSTPPLGIKPSIKKGDNHELEKAFMYGLDMSPKGDLVFAQHLLASLKDNGKGVLLLPMGALFRGGREETLRKKMLEDGFVRAVIELPVGVLAPYTSVKTAIVLFSKEPRNKEVLLVNLDSSATQKYIERIGRASVKITDEGVGVIAEIVNEVKVMDGLSKIVDVGDIICNSNNLCPGAYLNAAKIEDIQIEDITELIRRNTILLNKLTHLDKRFKEITEKL